MKEGQTIGQWLNWDFKTDGDFKIYNKRGNLIYFEDETRYRAKWEYDSQGKVIYFKNSKGKIIDKRIPEIFIHPNGRKYKLIP